MLGILAKTREAPPDGSTHWSARRLARVLGMSHVTISRVWKAAGLRFEQRAADVIGLYLRPPRNAAVFCLDEKTAIQALDRLDPVHASSR
jgi:hypothetical protein